MISRKKYLKMMQPNLELLKSDLHIAYRDWNTARCTGKLEEQRKISMRIEELRKLLKEFQNGKR